MGRNELTMIVKNKNAQIVLIPFKTELNTCDDMTFHVSHRTQM